MRKCLISLLLFFFQLLSYSQKVEFEHLSNKEGLINSNVTSILKDSYGYMWVGTFNGLSRYDGYKFTDYRTVAGDTTSIADNFIRFVFEAKDGTLFIGFHYAGICTYDRETESFTRYRHNPNDPSSLSHDYVMSMYQDKKGNIWVGTRGGLDKFDLNTKTFSNIQNGLQQDYFVSSICEDERGNLWLYGRGDQVCKFNPKTQKAEYISFASNYTKNNTFYQGGMLKYDSKGNLWIGTEGHGLFKYNTTNGGREWYSIQNEKLKSNFIFDIMEDSKGSIWVGTDGGGLNKYNYQTNHFQVFEHDPNDLASLSSNAIYCIYESSPGTLWIGMYAGGINIYKKDKKKFDKFTSIGKLGYCLSQKSVLAIAPAKQGKVWIGTDGGGMDLYDSKTNTFKYFNKSNSKIHSNIIKSIFVDKDSNLWLGSYGSGLCKLNLDKGSSEVFRGDTNSNGNSILNDHVWAITQSRDNKIWVGLISYGINVYDPELKKFIYYSFDSTAFKKAMVHINVFLQDQNNRMWIGSETEGLGYFDPLKKSIVRIKFQDKMPGTISSKIIRDIYEDSKGNIWIATSEGGLCQLKDIEKEVFDVYTVKDGLPSNNIQNILEDDHGNLWLSTDKGISKFVAAEKQFINFTVEDGLQNKEFNYRAAHKSEDGYMYFGGIQGFNKFHPDSIHYNTSAPKVVLTDFKIFNTSIHPNKVYNDNVYLNKSISIAEEITLTHEDFIFSVEFAALDFTSPEKNNYAYKLQGFNDNWTYVDATKRTVTYTNLDPGEYILTVIAANNDGVWNTTGTSLKIVVLPPWWMTIWFKAVVTLSFFILLAGLYYRRIRGIKERNRFLEMEVKKRTSEISAQKQEIIEQRDKLEESKIALERLNNTKDKFFSIIGHDLRGPVSALTLLAGFLKGEQDRMNVNDRQKEIINHVEITSHRIKNLVLNLLEWARTQSGQIIVKSVPVSILKVLKENVDLLTPQAELKHISVEVDCNRQHIVVADYNMISTIIRNILSNSIKYTPNGGSITIRSSLVSEDQIEISIKDTGIGMEDEILKNLFSLEKTNSVKGTNNEIGTGLGMIISKEFTELNMGKIYAKSTVGKGSTFFLLLPINVSISVENNSATIV